MKKNADYFVDIHSHVLYGVDDGPKTLEESLEMLWLAEQEGITHIIATPHFRADRRYVSRERVTEHFNRLCQEAEKQEIPITLYLGNEIYYCDGTEEAIEQKKAGTLNGSEYLLIEFSPHESFVYIRNALDQVTGFGYLPILAHAERYDSILKETGQIRLLKEMGVRIQVNAASILSRNRLSDKKILHRLLKEQLVDYIATDAHDLSDRKPEIKRCVAHLYKKYEQSYIDAILYRNAEEILTDC